MFFANVFVKVGQFTSNQGQSFLGPLYTRPTYRRILHERICAVFAIFSVFCYTVNFCSVTIGTS